MDQYPCPNAISTTAAVCVLVLLVVVGSRLPRIVRQKGFFLTTSSKKKKRTQECISDSCFNGKWKSIEMFLNKQLNTRNIGMVLGGVQQTHQHIFTPDFFDRDDKHHSTEIRELWKIVQKLHLTGFDRTIAPHELPLLYLQDPSHRKIYNGGSLILLLLILLD